LKWSFNIIINHGVYSVKNNFTTEIYLDFLTYKYQCTNKLISSDKDDTSSDITMIPIDDSDNNDDNLYLQLQCPIPL